MCTGEYHNMHDLQFPTYIHRFMCSPIAESIQTTLVWRPLARAAVPTSRRGLITAREPAATGCRSPAETGSCAMAWPSSFSGPFRTSPARMDADKSLRQAARVFENTAEGVVITDPEENDILAVNQGVCRDHRLHRGGSAGRHSAHPELGAPRRRFLSSDVGRTERSGQWRGELWNRHKNGRIFPELMTISAVVDGSGKLTHYVGVFRDISHLKQYREKLEFLAHHDPLTGLPQPGLFFSGAAWNSAFSARRDTSGWLACCFWIWIVSRSSTIHSAIRSAMHCFSKSPTPCPSRCGRRTRSPALEAIRARHHPGRHSEGPRGSPPVSQERLMTAFSQPFTVEGHELLHHRQHGDQSLSSGWGGDRCPGAPCRYRHVSSQNMADAMVSASSNRP